MSRTPGNSDDDLAVPIVPESSGPTEPLSTDGALTSGPVDSSEMSETSPAFDSELWAREAQAARDSDDAATVWRAGALECARALLADRQGDEAAALSLWRAAFDRDPSLLIAFWGLRRALVRQGAWEELLGVLDRRIAAMSSAETRDARADLWLDHGRILEDRLVRDDEATQSYGFGLMEVPDHPGLLLSLLLLGFRSADAGLTAAALSGLLRRPLLPALRVSIAVRMSRLSRRATPQRALETLQAALQTVEPEVAGPLLTELSLLARATGDPAIRARILDELGSRLLTGSNAPNAPARAADAVAVAGPDGEPAPEMGAAVAIVRERARLLGDQLDDPARAMEALRVALARRPRHPLLGVALADLIEAQAQAQAQTQAQTNDGHGDAATQLRDLLAEIAPGDRPYGSDAERDLVFRYLTTLLRDGRAVEGLAVLDRHPELPRLAPDWFALEVLLRTVAGDRAGLAAAFEQLGERLGAGNATEPPDQEAAAHALVVAGTLRESIEVGEGAANRSGDPTRHYRRAVEVAPEYEPALAAIERLLWEAGRWRELAALWEQRLAQLKMSAEPDGVGDDPNDEGIGEANGGGAGSDGDGRAVAPTTSEGPMVERARILEDLVALHRDLLDDPVAACRYQDEILASGHADARAWVRRYDLELAVAARGAPSDAATRVRILRSLAEHAGEPEVESAFRIEAARAAAAGGDAETAEVLLREARPGDSSGSSTAGLERLAATAGGGIDGAIRAELVRSEIAQLIEADAPIDGANSGARNDEDSDASKRSDASERTDDEKEARLRALRFRVAWHAQGAKRASEALEALQPLRAAGDELAWAWSWDIARRSGDPKLELAILRGSPRGGRPDRLELPSDLGEALERAGDLTGAESAFLEAQRQQPSSDAALGLLRIGSVRGRAALIAEAVRDLAALGDAATAPVLFQDAALLALLHGGASGASGAPPPVPLAGHAAADGDDPADVVRLWVSGMRGAEALGAAAGLLAVARAVPNLGSREAIADRNGLLARAAARARLGGTALGGAVHDQVHALSAGAAPIAVGLADLPVAGRPERIAARVARAAHSGVDLAYALDIERALDAEARGLPAVALDGFADALRRDAEGIEALEGIKRLALATGDRLGAARAGMRLGAILNVPARAAAEFGMAGQIWEDLAMAREAAIAYWQALRRDPESPWLYERLRHILGTEPDGVELDRLFGHRLAVLADPRARLELLLERAGHRLRRMNDSEAAIEDFKRILKIDPDHVVALRQLALLAVQMRHFPQAIRFLEALLARQTDPVQMANLRLELAEVYESAREPGRAVDLLRRAVSARPHDAAPWQRLSDLQLRMGDWLSALGTLQSWDAVLADPIPKAEIWIRVGTLLRDHGRDRDAAAAAFTTAAELNPLGDGVAELVRMHEQAGAPAARRGAIQSAIAGVRKVLLAEPLDIAHLRRLRELYQLSAKGGDSVSSDVAAAGATVAGQILELAGEEVAPSRPRQKEIARGKSSSEIWNRLRAPGTNGLAEDIWPALASATAELFPAAQVRHPQRDRVAAGSESRLAWVEAAAEAVGLSGVELFLPKAGTGEAADTSATPLDGSSRPGILLGVGVLAGDAEARFRVGRALSLLRDRAVVFDRMTDGDLATLLSAAGVVSGATSRIGAGGKPGVVEDQAKVLTKAMNRKDRKALELQTTRFATEPLDAKMFRQSVLATADRLGLMLAGDVAVAVRIAGGFAAASDNSEASETVGTTGARAANPTPQAVAANQRASDLIRFALSEDYLSLGGAGEG